ncbi:MAG: hypothetical protein D6732_26860 [Methanobacteriota archaeon]|nr:MAG: hypothetical protein D6732_26860 [Euryarchaeota archaeon]
MTVSYGLPIDFHDDGTPIFNRGDFIRDPIPLNGDNQPLLYENLILPEHRHFMPEIKFNLIVLPPAKENPTTAFLNERNQWGRVIQALDPNCSALIQQRIDKTKVRRFFLYHMKPMQFILPPPEYESQLVNNSKEKPAKYFEINAKEERRDLHDLLALNGFGYRMTMQATLDPNPNYDELPIPEIRQGLEQFKFLTNRPLYTLFVNFPHGFSFIDPPNVQFFSGAV